ncbi:11350_t:CDS:2 [Entrophospora sp. SA101]|nr:7905_t:CDS:2 [Entrophospora sp. SA101]CAJ0841032.1 11350_t:CDS:2 [Entrophospora sp. SA101]CAJ0888322.1 122_t:CDS:2 [Entrophospora sp. SA101]CAJ0919331.1 1007_t:CDS:2 [Entrophospora sp. SA101]
MGLLKNTYSTDFDEIGLSLRPALRLQFKTIKNIAQYLESQQDKLNFCLVNRAWTPAATETLWSEPNFKTLDSLHSFLHVVGNSKECALRVRVLNLCAPDENNVSSFVPVLRSARPEHQIMSAYFLSKPNFIIKIAMLCENIQRIKIYGWNLYDNHIQSLYQYCSDLKEILIIGNKKLTHMAFFPLMNCIHVLDLDGIFDLADNFAMALANKCPGVTSLKLSTKVMTEKGFDVLANKLTRLNNLILQNCLHLTDQNIQHFAQQNSKLKNFQLLGKSLTIKSFKVVMDHLKELEYFDFRCLQKISCLSTEIQWLKPLCQNLQVIILENLPIDDNTITIITIHCKQIVKFAISNCPYVTDNSINSIAENEKKLSIIDLHYCHNITDISLKYLGYRSSASLTRVIIESCGFFVPETIQWFVKVVPKLEKIVFNGTPSITNSFIYQFATEKLNGNYYLMDHTKCTIEKENIKKLAQFQNMPNIFQEDKINELAIELGFPADVIDNAIRKVFGNEQQQSISQGNNISIQTSNRNDDSVRSIINPDDQLDISLPQKDYSNQGLIFNEFQDDYLQNISTTKTTTISENSSSSIAHSGEWNSVNEKKTESFLLSNNIILPVPNHSSQMESLCDDLDSKDESNNTANNNNTVVENNFNNYDAQKILPVEEEPLVQVEPIEFEFESPSSSNVDNSNVINEESLEQTDLKSQENELKESITSKNCDENISDDEIEFIQRPQTNQSSSNMESTSSNDTNKSNPQSEKTYLSFLGKKFLMVPNKEWPTLAEAVKISDNKKYSGTSSSNITSPWNGTKKWTTDKKIDTPEAKHGNSWNPSKLNRSTLIPIQKPKDPINFKKKKIPYNNFDMDDNRGWGPPPPIRGILWNDSDQISGVNLLKEENNTTYSTQKNNATKNKLKGVQEQNKAGISQFGINHLENKGNSNYDGRSIKDYVSSNNDGHFSLVELKDHFDNIEQIWNLNRMDEQKSTEDILCNLISFI